MTIHAPKTRNFLAEIIATLPSTGLSTAKIISRLKDQQDATIKEESGGLHEIAFVRIISQISSRPSNATTNVTPDLFGKYGIQPTLFVTVNIKDGSQRVLKNVGDATFGEVEQYVSGQSKPRTRVTKHVKELAKLAKDGNASGAKSGDTIGEWWAREAKRGGQG
jgi:hypothetical protein